MCLASAAHAHFYPRHGFIPQTMLLCATAFCQSNVHEPIMWVSERAQGVVDCADLANGSQALQANKRPVAGGRGYLDGVWAPSARRPALHPAAASQQCWTGRFTKWLAGDRRGRPVTGLHCAARWEEKSSQVEKLMLSFKHGIWHAGASLDVPRACGHAGMRAKSMSMTSPTPDLHRPIPSCSLCSVNSHSLLSTLLLSLLVHVPHVHNSRSSAGDGREPSRFGYGAV